MLLGRTGAEEVAACDKAIVSDPKKADAYFIKSSLLFGDSKIDKNNKIVVPPGTVEVLKQYLALAPTGSHASDVKQMLDALKWPQGRRSGAGQFGLGGNYRSPRGFCRTKRRWNECSV